MPVKLVGQIVECCVASKKVTKTYYGALVVTRETIYLTPQQVDLAVEIENWIEWTPEQLGLVIGQTKDKLCLVIATINGIGSCFPDEIMEVETLKG